MVVTEWGAKPRVSKITSMPFWIKLTNVPECYWTEEGLSRLASVVASPIGVDALTSKLDLLQFAKLCMKYEIGDPLPNEISASVLDPSTDEMYTAKIQVSYHVRPLSCSGCKSLGHTIGACPVSKIHWVQKTKAKDNVDSAQTEEIHTSPPDPLQNPELNVSEKEDSMNGNKEDVGWTTVIGKKSKASNKEEYNVGSHGDIPHTPGNTNGANLDGGFTN